MNERPIDDWFFDWMVEHQDFTQWGDWPPSNSKPGLVFYGGFLAEMKRFGFTRAMATDATNALAGRPDPGRGQYLDAVLEYARSIRKAERDVEHRRMMERRLRLLAVWDAMPEAEREPVRERVLAADPSMRTLPRMLRILCAESLEPEAAPAG